MFVPEDQPITPARLLRLFERGRAFVEAMTAMECEAYFARQRRNSVLAEIAAGNEDATVVAQS